MEKLRKEFNINEIVYLDIDKPNYSEVIVVSQTPQKLFTTVKSIDGNAQWEVMTNRLTTIINE